MVVTDVAWSFHGCWATMLFTFTHESPGNASAWGKDTGTVPQLMDIRCFQPCPVDSPGKKQDPFHQLTNRPH